MKKILAMLLAVCFVLGLAACGKGAGNQTIAPSGQEAAAPQVGFGRTDITPEEPMPLASYGDEDTRISTGFIEKLEANALAVTDAKGNTLLIVTGDLSWCGKELGARIRQTLSDEFDIPGDNIILTGTHNHSAPSTVSTTDPLRNRYREQYVAGMVEAGRLAMADRKPAQMYIGTVDAEGMNFVRRYELLDGTYPNFETVSSDKIKGHESEADDDLQLLKFVREGGKDVLVYNWQAHANLVSHDKNLYKLISTDFFGPFRAEVENKLDVHCFLWQGAAGNLNPESQIDGETPTTDHKEYGKMLARFAVEAYNNAVPAEMGDIKVLTYTYAGEVNHSFDHVLDKAMEIQAYYKATGDQDTCREMGKPYGINTRNHAARIVANAKLGKTQDIPMKVACIGSVGFIVLYYEMFDTNAMYIRENSPFDMTFVIGYSENVGLGYIPSALAEGHGGYEVDNNTFVNGTGNLVQDKYVELLKEIAK